MTTGLQSCEAAINGGKSSCGAALPTPTNSDSAAPPLVQTSPAAGDSRDADGISDESPQPGYSQPAVDQPVGSGERTLAMLASLQRRLQVGPSGPLPSE